jgi:hypothetical protein
MSREMCRYLLDVGAWCGLVVLSSGEDLLLEHATLLMCSLVHPNDRLGEGVLDCHEGGKG